jgi:hypothetical protein
MREIDFRLDLIARRPVEARCPARGWRFACGSVEVRPHFLRFMFFERAGVGLLLGNAHHGKHVKNCLALNFQLPGQIIDSNLAHSPLCSSALFR